MTQVELNTNVLNPIMNGMSGCLSGLYSRWQDEKQYEDFKDYSTVIKKKVESIIYHHCPSVKLEKVTKSPFGFIFTVDSLPSHVFQFKVTSREMSITPKKVK